MTETYVPASECAQRLERAAIKAGRGNLQLLRLLRAARPAHSTKIEWLQEMIVRPTGKLVRYAEFNYTEIFRGHSENDVIRKVRRALWSQTRPYLDLSGGEPHGQMGGIRYYKVFPEYNGDVQIRVLRDLVKLERGDYLCELSVQVTR